MIVEIISTGTELLLGQIINTTASYLAQEMNELGFDTLYQTTVGDNHVRMGCVIEAAMKRADIIIMTGGLGPTKGDITKEVLCHKLNIPMYLHQESIERIKSYFDKIGCKMTDNNLRQAMMPEGAIAVDNNFGTAPCVILEHDGKIFILLPGPPREVEGVFGDKIKPYLEKKFPKSAIIYSKVLQTYGIGESALEERLYDIVLKQNNPTIAFLARPDCLFVRLTAKADNKEAAENLIMEVEEKVRSIAGEFIVAEDNGSLAATVVELLHKKKYILSTAESCTGGLIASAITAISGSSQVFHGAAVTYDNSIKKSVLGVSESLLQKHGAVSEEVASEMARGALRVFNSDIAVAVSGIAGPTGGTLDKPVGLCYIALASGDEVICRKFNMSGERNQIRMRVSQMALNITRKYLLGYNI